MCAHARGTNGITVRWVDQQRKNVTICSDTRPDLFILVLVARDEQPPQEPVWQSVLDDADLTVGVRHVAAYTSAGRLRKHTHHTHTHTHTLSVLRGMQDWCWCKAWCIQPRDSNPERHSRRRGRCERTPAGQAERHMPPSEAGREARRSPLSRGAV
jgi:hypothetical protein